MSIRWTCPECERTFTEEGDVRTRTCRNGHDTKVMRREILPDDDAPEPATRPDGR